jgi:hypothetical protein
MVGIISVGGVEIAIECRMDKGKETEEGMEEGGAGFAEGGVFEKGRHLHER